MNGYYNYFNSYPKPLTGCILNLSTAASLKRHKKLNVCKEAKDCPFCGHRPLKRKDEHGNRKPRDFKDITEITRHMLSENCLRKSAKADQHSVFGKLHKDKNELEARQMIGFKVVEKATTFGNIRKSDVGQTTEWERGTKARKRKLTFILFFITIIIGN